MNTTQITSLPVAFHPGETLSEKLKEMEMTEKECAEKANLPECIVNAIVREEISITADIALALEEATQIPAYMWLRMQNRYDEYILSQHKKTSYIEHLQRFTRTMAAML